VYNARTPLPRPSLDDWLGAVPGLKLRGGEWVGACPACGGVDRFWVRRGDTHDAVATCRQGCEFVRLLDAAGLKSPTREMSPSPRYWQSRAAKQARGVPSNATGGGEHRATSPYAPSPARRIDTARAIWTAAGEMESTPAAVYLRLHRRVWPARVAFPEAVRWLPRDAAPRWLREGKSAMPASATGALAFRFIDAAGEVVAVSLDALTDAGDRAVDAYGGRWRRTFGVVKGAACPVGTHGGAPIVVVEGAVTALAAVWLTNAGAQVMAAGGANNLRALIPMLSRTTRPVEVWADNDPVGRGDGAIRLAAGLRRAGVDATVKFDYSTGAPGSDAADYLNAVIAATGWPAHAHGGANETPTR